MQTLFTNDMLIDVEVAQGYYGTMPMQMYLRDKSSHISELGFEISL